MNAPTPSTAQAAALSVSRRLHDAGFDAYFAGGCVRDRLMGCEPKDYDIATSARPQDVLSLFPKSNEVGAHFGVILVKHAGHMMEVATFRTDGSYKDGRHPESVSFSTPQEDAQRRDFTINGLFENPLTGEIIDFVGGLDDLQSHTLRAIGRPHDRFSEDALRLLRAVRFHARTGFELDPTTRSALLDCAPQLTRISPERIRDELTLILTGPRRGNALALLSDTTLIDYFLPEVRALIGCDQPPEWHPEGDVFTHTRIMLDLLAENAPPDLCLAVLLHDIAKPPCRTVDPDGRIRFNGHDAMGADMATTILRRLRYPNDVIDRTSFMVSRHMQFMHVQQMRIAKLRRFMGEPTFPLELELHRVDCASSNGFTDNYDFLRNKQDEFANEPIIPPPLVTGHDLIKLGLKPGPLFKSILESVQTEQLEGRLTDRVAALLHASSLLEKNHYS
jgi:tRNA nucleotidyltransferase/poly(A) polymerase